MILYALFCVRATMAKALNTHFCGNRPYISVLIFIGKGRTVLVLPYFLFRKDRKKGKVMTTKNEAEKEIAKALDFINIKWSREDLESVLEDAGIPVTDENLSNLCKQIGEGFREMLITDVFQRLSCLV